MKALMVTSNSDRDLKFISELLKKMGFTSSTFNVDDAEDFFLLDLMKKADKTKKVSRSSVMKKLKG